VDIENGSGISGAAREVADVLRHEGFTIGEISDADRFNYNATEIHQHSNVTFAGAKVRSALPQALRQAPVLPDPPPASSSPMASAASNSDVTVIVGSDVARKAPPLAPDHS
jgi:hypothetical protein